jgi:hypothetical protein
MLLVKLSLQAPLLIYALYGSVNDDNLQLNLARSLLSGHWLGTYNSLTLSKGPVYPMFEAITSSLGIPILTAQTLLFFAACCTIVYALRGLVSRRWLAMLYTILMFNPISYATESFLRVYRDSIYPALTLFVVACFFILWRERKAAPKKAICISVLAGLAISSIWFTREDSVWILPYAIVACVVSCIVLSVEWKKSSSPANLPVFLRKVAFQVIPFAILAGCGIIFAFTNFLTYGIFSTNTFSNSNFLKAYSALSSIASSYQLERITVTAEMRHKAYDVSPAFAELEPVFEGGLLSAMAVYDPAPPGEIHNGHFVWAFLGAVQSLGYYGNAQKAEGYYKRVSDELNAALNDGRLKRSKGGPSPSVFLTAMRPEYFRKSLEKSVQALKFVLKFDGMRTAIEKSYGPAGEFEALLHSKAVDYGEPGLALQGWFASREYGTSLAINDDKGFLLRLGFSASPDVEDSLKKGDVYYNNAGNARFSVNFTTSAKTLWLVASANGKEFAKIPLDGSVRSGNSELFAFHFDLLDRQIQHDSYLSSVTPIDKRKVVLLNGIIRIFQIFFRYLFLLGVFAYIYVTVRVITRSPTKMMDTRSIWLFLTGVGLCFILRLCVIAYTSVAAFESINYLYLSPAYALAIIFSATSIAAAAMDIYARRHMKNSLPSLRHL